LIEHPSALGRSGYLVQRHLGDTDMKRFCNDLAAEAQ
jgi:hypothetical protein